eukprot:CAMPEP_0179420126 /NCGR_PEP_ID=MMETSP0799-20121207/8994_1 /TAXON_ID=46947 /ORGANISM="Geminigera cryophila, Strain CCMP2564" /LENGTH=380 /DNA_ID=CAMNT_0021193701 /DNA_START=111 /DNA_END=1250 /DNA_ORIENTATION=+
MSTEATKVAARNVILSAKNHYEVMSLSKDCEEDEVKKRHRELVRMVHPDKLQLSSDSENLKTQQAFRAVQVAYETLSVSHKRFVPGESNGEDSTGDEMDEGPSIATVLLMLIQIVLAVVVYVGNETVQDVLHIFTTKALVLQVCTSLFLVLAFGMGWSLLYAWTLCACVYSVHALVGIRKFFVYIAMVLILQAHNWNKKGGVPFWVGSVSLFHLWWSGGSLLRASCAGTMCGLMPLISLLMPHFSFGANAFYAAIAAGYIGAYWLPLDVFFALFVADVAWHFLQGLPSVCLGVLGTVILYIVYAISPSFSLFVLALGSVCIGTNYMGLLVITCISTFTLAVGSWGWSGAFLLAVGTWGMRRTMEGLGGGKRMVLSVGLVW